MKRAPRYITCENMNSCVFPPKMPIKLLIVSTSDKQNQAREIGYQIFISYLSVLCALITFILINRKAGQEIKHL